jgi:hypothetical protein
MIEDRFVPRTICVRHTSRDEGAATADSLGVNVSVFLTDAGLGQCADDTAGCAAGQRCHAGQSRQTGHAGYPQHFTPGEERV